MFKTEQNIDFPFELRLICQFQQSRRCNVQYRVLVKDRNIDSASFFNSTNYGDGRFHAKTFMQVPFRKKSFFWQRLFLDNGFFWKRSFFGSKKIPFQKKPFPKKALSKKIRSPQFLVLCRIDTIEIDFSPNQRVFYDFIDRVEILIVRVDNEHFGAAAVPSG